MLLSLRSFEKGMNDLTAEAMDKILKRLKVKGYAYNQQVARAVAREFKRIEPGLTEVAAGATLLLRKISQRTMKKRAKIAGLTVNQGLLNIITDKAKIANLSPQLHSTNRLIRNKFAKQLRKSLNAGESMTKIAKRLLKVENPAVNIPKHIREIEIAARKAIIDPKHYNDFKKVIRKHEKYIDNLTRAGEPGFEVTGMRGASKRFIRDIQNANAENIDKVVNTWKDRKSLYHQKVVARNEATLAYNEYNSSYMRETDYIIGEEWFVSQSHPIPDECDDQVGIHLYKDGTPPVPIVDTHINCLCYTTAVIDTSVLEEEQAA
jgi:hypothetical protein